MQFSTALTQGFRNYWSHVVGFSPNARLFLFSNFLGGVVISIYSLLFNFYLISLGYREDFLGLVASIGQMTVFISALPAGMLSDMLGRKRALVLALVLNSLSLLGLIVLTDRVGIIALSILYGLSTALFVVTMSPFMMENSGEAERTHLFSMNQAVIAASGFAGGFIGGNAPAWFGAWLGVGPRAVGAYQAGIIAATIINLISIVPLVMLRKRSGAPRRVLRHPLSGVRSEARILFMLLFPNLLIGLGAGLLIPFSNVFLRTHFSVDDSQVGIIFSTMAVVAGVSIAFGPVLAQRLGKMRAVIFAQACSVPLILLVGFSPIALLGILAFIVRPSFMQLSGPIFDAFAMENVGEDTRATYSSLNQMVWTVGWIISPLISGQVQVMYGWQPILVGMAVFYGMGVALTQLFFGSPSSLSERIHFKLKLA